MDSLPYELKVLIWEYNVEHRPKMKKVLSELTSNGMRRGTCEGCDIGKIAAVYTYSPRVFICSIKCLQLYIELLPDGCPDKYDHIFWYEEHVKRIKK